MLAYKLKTYAFYFLLMGMICSGCIKNITAAEALQAVVSPGDAANITLSPSFPVTVNITSKMPELGVYVYVNVYDEATNTAVTPQISSFTTFTNANSFSVQNLPQQKWCVVYIKLVEVNNKNNTVTKTFRVIYK